MQPLILTVLTKPGNVQGSLRGPVQKADAYSCDIYISLSGYAMECQKSSGCYMLENKQKMNYNLYVIYACNWVGVSTNYRK